MGRGIHVLLSRSQLLRAVLAAAAGLIPRAAQAKLPAGGSAYFSFTMQGESMEPTLHNSEVVHVDRTAYSNQRPRRGDLIVFRAAPAGEPDRLFLKRVIGLPGEVVAVRQGRVYINGHAIPEPYVRTRAAYFYPARRVPPNRYFVLGDNRNNSYDSSKWPDPWLPLRDILGRVALIGFLQINARLLHSLQGSV